MPAVVRGGRRQSAGAAPRRGGASRSRATQARNAPATPGKLAAFGRLDLSPRAVVISLVAGAALLGAVLFTGSRADRVGASVSKGMDGVAASMGLGLRRVNIQGASDEAKPAIQAALDLQAGQAITGIDLDAVREQVEGVGWVKEARIVRLLPDTLVIAVTEHDRLAVWQTAGRNVVIDADGKVISGADAGRYPNLPLVVGLGAEQAAGEILPLLRQRPRLMQKIDALVRVDERRWNLRMKDGGVIQLPATEQEAALIRLDAMDQRERLLDLGFARVDLRTPEAVTVRPGEAAA